MKKEKKQIKLEEIKARKEKIKERLLFVNEIQKEIRKIEQMKEVLKLLDEL